MKPKVGLVYTLDLHGEEPLAMIKPKKRKVYFRLLEMIQEQGWEAWVLSRLTYEGGNVFKGGWQYQGQGRFSLEDDILRTELVFDKTGGLTFPPENESGLRVINRRDFKILAWNKWEAYLKFPESMPATYWVGRKENLIKVLPKIRGRRVVLKPYNGLMGKGIFIGEKESAENFSFSEQYPLYIAQEFIDTSGGIEGIELAPSSHDLRVVIINGKPVYAHVRRPARGSWVNSAHAGEIDEIAYSQVPKMIDAIARRVGQQIGDEYDNPIFSLDFGVGRDGPKIFEINDQISFPRWHWLAREPFLRAIITNFKEKIWKE